jgi:hypothetical protein
MVMNSFKKLLFAGSLHKGIRRLVVLVVALVACQVSDRRKNLR